MAILFPLFAVIIWAINAIVNKLSAGAIDPAAISFYRWALAVAILTPFILPGVIRNRKTVYLNLGKLLILGLLGMALYQSLAYYAAYTISALTIGIFVSLIPLLTVLISVAVLRVPPTLGTVLGGILSFSGIVWLISAGNPGQLLHMGVGKGELMMLAAAISYALYGVLTKRWAIPLTSWQSLYVQAFFGALALLPNFLMTADVSLNATNIPLVLYAGIPASILAPYFWILGVMKLGANKAALFMNLAPLFTAVIAISVLHEPLHSYHIIGGGVALIGVILAQRLRTPIGKRKP
ncbi:DMT family transporter [Budvicia diplopodorum]|uniref:DMT family transporter n=1 Tax=Budvicia diplopodorum TaxID=1119056 RepID=UPI0013576FFD|nr:DMT family transporter [Budvicia diplopodorum]